MTEPKKYTKEVLEALGQRGFTPERPKPPPVPEGMLPYHLAVGQTRVAGQASPQMVIAQLEQLIAQLRQEHNL
jgi:hypothetical protein